MSQYFENNQKLKNKSQQINIKFKNQTYNLITNSGLFSKDKFDYGSRLLLENITTRNLEGNILDLGCGYGAIGIIIASIFPQLTVDMTDVTNRAIETTKKNIQNLNIKNTVVYKSDIYENIKNKYNYIITNPPIRAGKNTVRKFLLNAKEYLKKEGELWFVMRKDHGVKSMIKELEDYYKVSIQEKSKGFYIVKCQVK